MQPLLGHVARWGSGHGSDMEKEEGLGKGVKPRSGLVPTTHDFISKKKAKKE